MIIVYIAIGIIIGWITKIPWFYNKIKLIDKLMYNDLDVLFNTLIQNIVAHKDVKDNYKKRYEEIKKRYTKL